MAHRADAPRDLLFGLLALQNGMVSRDQLVAAFGVWTASDRPMADLLVEQGALSPPRRDLLEALAAEHLAAHGGDPEQSLAALDLSRSTRESLAAVGGPEVEATLAQVGSGSTPDGDADRTWTYAVGTSTSDGQRFRVLRPHARGGLGAVFVALDSELHREVALKQILDSHADDPVSRQRFLIEAEITGGLEHPGIVPVYGLGTYAGGRPYYAMRFVQGDSLKEAIERYHAGRRGAEGSGGPARTAPRARKAARPADPGGLELRRLLRRFTDVCDAIGYAHSRGVLHRDIKPGNVIVGQYGETLVIDWGLAKATGRAEPGGETTLRPSSAGGAAETLRGTALGTIAYMSPEQAAFDPDALGPRSDVYGLGATLYCLLTGRPPVEVGEDVGEALRRVRAGEFPRPRQVDPSVDPALEAVCLKAMATQPEDRYPSCRALADDVERWAADEAVAAWCEPSGVRARRWMRRHRAAATSAAAALAVIAVGAVAAAVAIDSARRREAGARFQADQRKTEALAQRQLAVAQRATAETRRREALSIAAGAQLDRARSLGDAGQVGVGMLWAARALDSAVQAGDAQLAHVARVNLVLDRLRLPAVWTVSDKPLRIPARAVETLAPAPDLPKLPAGQRVISTSPDRRVALIEFLDHTGPARLLDLRDGRVLADLGRGYFFASGYSPRGDVLAKTAPDGTITLVDTHTGVQTTVRVDLPKLEPGKKRPVQPYHFRFLADGKSLLTDTVEGEWTLWDVATGMALTRWSLPAPRGKLIVARDGSRIAATVDATTARVWDAATGQPVGVPIRVKDPINILAPSGNGRFLGIHAGDEARAYRVEDGEPASPPLPMSNPIGSIPLLVRDDGQVVLGTDRGTFVLLDVPTGRVSQFNPSGMMASAVFSEDGRFLLTGEYRVAVLRDARTGRPAAPPLEAQSVVTADFALDGKVMTLSGQDFRAHEVEDGRHAGLRLPVRGAMCVAYRPDGKEVAVASREGVRRYDAASGQPIGEVLIPGPSSGLTVVLYNPAGDRLYAGDPGKQSLLIETATSAVAAQLPRPGASTISARFSPDGSLLAVADREGLRLWDTRTGQAIGDQIPFEKPVCDPQKGLYFHPEGRAIAAVTSPTTVNAWRLPSREPASPPIVFRPHVFSVRYSPDGSRLAVGVFGGGMPVGALLVDSASGKTIAGLAHTGLVESLAFTPDGRILITSSQDRTVKFWDARDGKPAAPTLRLPTDPRIVVVAPDGRSFLTVENWHNYDPSTTKARLWDMATHRPLGPPLVIAASLAYDAAFAPDSRSLVIGSFWPDNDSAPADAHDAVIWRLPPPVPNDATPERVALWVEVATGYALAADNSPEQLSAADWQARKERLDFLGGPPVAALDRLSSQRQAGRSPQQTGIVP
jgi:WD40 repeat protein